MPSQSLLGELFFNSPLPFKVRQVYPLKPGRVSDKGKCTTKDSELEGKMSSGAWNTEENLEYCWQQCYLSLSTAKQRWVMGSCVQLIQPELLQEIKHQQIKTFSYTSDLEKGTERKREEMELAVLSKREGSFEGDGRSKRQWGGNENQVLYQSTASLPQSPLTSLRTTAQQHKARQIGPLS